MDFQQRRSVTKGRPPSSYSSRRATTTHSTNSSSSGVYAKLTTDAAAAKVHSPVTNKVSKLYWFSYNQSEELRSDELRLTPLRQRALFFSKWAIGSLGYLLNNLY